MRRRGLFGVMVMAILGIAAAGVAQERFDYAVRDDMFRAFGGNEAAFKNAMAKIDATLAANPDHAEALVWRGAGTYWKAGQAFRGGDVAGGRALATAAMADLDRALALAPRDIGVLIPPEVFVAAPPAPRAGGNVYGHPVAPADAPATPPSAAPNPEPDDAMPSWMRGGGESRER